MRACWIDEGSDPDYALLHANGIDTVCRSIREKRTTLAALKADVAAGFASNVYFAANWYPQDAPESLADRIAAMLTALAPGSPPDFPSVCADIETHNAAFILGFLGRWRAHRPTRITDWTLEGHQGGILTATQWLLIFRFVRYVVPQSYDGNMTPWDTFAMARDLYDHGFPMGSVVPFVDAAHLLPWWQGYAFTQGRLPR